MGSVPRINCHLVIFLLLNISIKALEPPENIDSKSQLLLNNNVVKTANFRLSLPNYFYYHFKAGTIIPSNTIDEVKEFHVYLTDYLIHYNLSDRTR
jgi:hypothetical protein